MSLLTDGTPADIECLRGYESGIIDVAQVEDINLDSKLKVAASETGDAILRFLLLQNKRDWWLPGGVNLSSVQLRQTGLGHVVVTPSLRRWHAIHTIENVYREAYGNQLNERYAQKLGEYAAASRRASEEFFEIGVGLVSRPVSKAAIPSASATAAGDSYFVQVSCLDSAGNEGAPSDIAILCLATSSSIMMGTPADPAAVSWNVYLGATSDSVRLQNARPIDMAQQWFFPGNVVAGRRASAGQQPDYFVVNNHVLPRG